MLLYVQSHYVNIHYGSVFHLAFHMSVTENNTSVLDDWGVYKSRILGPNLHSR